MAAVVLTGQGGSRRASAVAGRAASPGRWAWVAVALAIAPPLCAFELPAEVAGQLRAACVEVRTLRSCRTAEVVSVTTGVAVSPGGLVVSDGSAVESWIPGASLRIDGTVETRVVSHTGWVVDERRGVREVKLELVARDPASGLVLLRPLDPLPATLDILGKARATPGEPLALVGFPSSGAAWIRSIPGPGDNRLTFIAGEAVEVAAGVTVDPRVLPTDLVSDAGHCGGPVIGAAGEVLGLAACSGEAEHRRVTVVTTDEVSRFVIGDLLTVGVEPGTIFDPAQPIDVRLAPLEPLGDIASDWTGSVHFLVEGEDRAQVPLGRDGEGWRAALERPSEVLAGAERVVAELRVLDGGGTLRYRREVSLDVIPAARVAAGEAAVGEQAPPPSPTPAQGSPPPPVTRDREGLAGLARTVELGRAPGENGDVVIDDGSVVSDELRLDTYVADPARYDALVGQIDSLAVARAFDRCMHDLTEVRHVFQALTNRCRTNPRSTRRCWDQRESLGKRYYEEHQRAKALRQAAADKVLAQCPDGSWHQRHLAPCTEPVLPELPEPLW